MSTQFSRNLKALMDNKKMNPTELSRLSGIAQPTVFKILKGQIKSPSIATAEALAQALQATLPQLIYSADLPKEADPVAGFRKVPLISWIQAGSLTPIEKLDDFDKWYLCPVNISEYGYALKVRGESMEPYFYEGDIVFIDPEACADPGKIVAAVDDGSIEPEATLKKLVKDGADYYLKALNPDWPGPKFIPFTGTMRIAGVAVGKYVEL